MTNSLQALAQELALVFSPLDGVRDAESTRALLADLGYDLPESVGDIGLAAFDLSRVRRALLDVLTATAGDDDPGLTVLVPLYAELLEALIEAVGNLRRLCDGLRSLLSASGDFAERSGIVDTLLPRLVDYLVVQHCLRRRYGVFAVLSLLGVFEIRSHAADEATYRTAHLGHTVHYRRLGTLLSDPARLPVEAYGWGTSAFDAAQLVGNLAAFLTMLGAPVQVQALSPETEEHFEGTAPAADATPLPQAVATVVDDPLDLGVDIGLSVHGLRPRTAGGADGGLGLLLWMRGSTETRFALGAAEAMHLLIHTDSPFSALHLRLRPEEAVDVGGSALGDDVPVLEGRVGLGLSYAQRDASPMPLVVVPGGSRFEIDELRALAGVERGPDGAFGPWFELGLQGGRFVVGLGEADGFVQSVASEDQLTAELDLSVSWSRARGLRFGGAGGLRLVLGLHRSAGPLELLSLLLGLSGGSEGVDLELGLSFSLELGPVTATIEEIGARLTLSFEDGNLGPVHLQPAFEPPSGIGISVESDVVTGGGYLYFESEEARYTGALQLAFGDIALGAVGLLTTREPDGSRGFSLLIVISTEFTPIQLGYGFTLNGVGGLVGVHRAIATDVLRSGLREGVLDAVLFPPDPIADAPRLIRELRAVFPPTRGRHLVGPMVVLGWGTPTIVRAELGVILELPDGPLAIVGQGRAALPCEEAALILIQVELLGILDFARGELSVDASIYDSRLLVFELDGDLALRLRWKGQPLFLLSVGGYHPRFEPPAGFPELRRLTVTTGIGSVIRILLESYITLSSNSLQFGARAELSASVGAFGLFGYFGFDLLFVFSPFSFDTQVAAGVAVRMGRFDLLSIELDFAFSGPRPWRAAGRASFRILFVRFSFRFDRSWGRSDPAELDAVDPWPLLEAALGDYRNWSARLPPGTQPVATLPGPSSTPAPDAPLTMHPMGTLEIRQSVLPLNRLLERFGSTVPAGATRYTLSELRAGSRSLEPQPVDDWFAPAQFESLTEEEKLSRRAYERMQAGVRAGTRGLVAGRQLEREYRYETKVLERREEIWSRAADALRVDIASTFVSSSAAGLRAARPRGLERFDRLRSAEPTVLPDEGFVIAGVDDLGVRHDLMDGRDSFSEAEALQRVRLHLQAHPEDRGNIQVVPDYEADD